jgi:DNA-binding transcriptional ArsR family regulator
MILSEKHRLEQPAASDDVIAERGTYSALRGKDVPQDSGKLPKKPGTVFPVHTLDGEIFHRIRFDNPGRLSKYRQPAGVPNRLDVHPRQHDRIKQPGGMRFITEGEKKVDAGVSRDLLMVGLSGVWNGQKDKELIPDWDHLPLEGENYCIADDSDIADNPNVQMAADRLARLLQERGANVYMVLLPPAADGSKQGLDDFFAGGHTLAELKLLIRPYSLQTVESARLTRSERLRAGLEDLERIFWDTEWQGMGGCTDRDVLAKLTEAARRHGKVVDDGLRVKKARVPLALEAKVSSRTLSKSIKRLEEMGVLRRDNEGRKADKSGAFVLLCNTRASVKYYGEGNGPTDQATTVSDEGKVTEDLHGRAPGTLHLRAPRLMWSRPKFTPRRGLVRESRRVRQAPKLQPRDRIERLGKGRGALIDALDASGGSLTVAQIAEILHRKRPRDIRRRMLPMLEDSGIVVVDGDGSSAAVSLTADWREALDEQRRLGKEIDGPFGEGAETIARRRYRLKSKAFHDRFKETKSEPSEAGMQAVKESRAKRAEYLRDHPTPDPDPDPPPLSPLAVAMRDYLERRPRDARHPPGWIGATLWALELYDGKPTPEESKAALRELGGAAYLEERLQAARRSA